MTQRVYINESKNKVPAKGEFTLNVDGQSYLSTTKVSVEFFNNDIKQGGHIIASQGATVAVISFPAHLTNGTHRDIVYIKDFDKIGIPYAAWGGWTEKKEDFEAEILGETSALTITLNENLTSAEGDFAYDAAENPPVRRVTGTFKVDWS
jgi:hypothetical protein